MYRQDDLAGRSVASDSNRSANGIGSVTLSRTWSYMSDMSDEQNDSDDDSTYLIFVLVLDKYVIE